MEKNSVTGQVENMHTVQLIFKIMKLTCFFRGIPSRDT